MYPEIDSRDRSFIRNVEGYRRPEMGRGGTTTRFPPCDASRSQKCSKSEPKSAESRGRTLWVENNHTQPSGIPERSCSSTAINLSTLRSLPDPRLGLQVCPNKLAVARGCQLSSLPSEPKTRPEDVSGGKVPIGTPVVHDLPFTDPLEFAEVPPAYEHATSINYAKLKWQSKTKSRLIHEQESKKYRRRKFKKKAQRLSKEGHFQNESDEVTPTFDKKVLTELLAAVPNRDDTIHRLIAIQLAFVANVCVSWTFAQFGAATLQMITSLCVATDVTQINVLLSHVGNWYKEPEKEAPEIENQDWISGLRETLVQFKDGAISYTSIPVWQQLSRCFVLASCVGLMPPEQTDSDGIIERALAAWSKRVGEEAKTTSFFTLILDSLIFTCDFLQGIKTGSFSQLLTPDDLQARATKLLAQEKVFVNGMLHSIGTTPGQYAEEVNAVYRDISCFARTMAHGQSRIIMNTLLYKLTVLQNTIKLSMSNIKPRTPAPIIALFGVSHVGKSGIMMMLADFAGKTLGFPGDDENFYYQQKGDDYDSGFTGAKTVIVIDDADAEADQFTTQKESADMIRFSNIVPYQSVQAALESKAAIPFLHRLTLVSTNSPDIGILRKFRHPEAGFNRVWEYRVSVKDEYCKPDGSYTANAPLGPNGSLSPFAHQFQQMTWVKTGNLVGRGHKARPGWTVHYGEMMDVPRFLLHIRERLIAHRDRGDSYCKQIEETRKLPLCEVCGLYKGRGYCICAEMENQAGALFPNGFDVNSPVMQAFGWLGSRIPSLADLITRKVLHQATILAVEGAVDSLSGLIMKVFLFNLRIFRWKPLLFTWCSIPFILNSLIIFGLNLFWLRNLLILWFVITYLIFDRVKKIYANACIKEMAASGSTSAVTMMVKMSQLAVGVAITLSSLFALKSVFNSVLSNQGNLSPKSMTDIEERKKEKNPWLGVRAETPFRDTNMITMTNPQVLSAISNNTVVLEAENDGRMYRTNALMVCGNVAIVPGHSFECWDIKKPLTIRRHVNFVGGMIVGSFITDSFEMGSDYVGILITKASAFRNISKFIHPGFKGEGACNMISRNEEGGVEMRTLFWRYVTNAGNESHVGEGSRHLCSEETRKGLCCSPIVLTGTPSMIVGMHMGGSTVRRNEAVGFTLTAEMVDKMLEHFGEKRMQDQGVYREIPIRASDPLLEQYGKINANLSPHIHERDCVNFTPPITIEKPHTVQVFGCDASQKFRRYSDVKVSNLSQFLEEAGNPNKWGPPKFNVNRNHSLAYQSICAPIKDVPLEVMQIVISDYLTPLRSTIAHLGMTARVLSDFEAINGVVGSRFARKMNMKTSAGFGLTQTKVRHFDEFIDPEGRKYYVPHPHVTDELEKSLALMKDGLIPSFIFKTALKDEPTKLTKDKVRVFQVAPLTLVILMRKFTLDIVDKLYYIPFVSEMVQGVNCTNDEWDQMGEHLKEYGDNCLEGDFSSYDLKLSGQMLRGAAFVMRELARAFGYSTEECDMVELIVLSSVSKYVLWNGTLIHIDSFNPSGIPLTIVLNGICNALLHRYAFYMLRSIHSPHLEGSFQDYVRMMFVGDDSVGVSKLKWYNMSSIQDMFVVLGCKYTDGRKSEVTQEFFPFSDIQLCKRKWVFNPYVQRLVAPIELDSIYKSLHCYMKSITCELDITVGNVDGALRELARHPEETFNSNAYIIRQACERAGISHFCPRLYLSYPEWWEILKHDFWQDNVSSDSEFISSLSDSDEENDSGSVSSTES